MPVQIAPGRSPRCSVCSQPGKKLRKRDFKTACAMTKLLLISIIFMVGCAKKPALQTKAVSTNADQTHTSKAQIDFIRREFIKFKLCWPMKSTDDSDVSEADWAAQLRREAAKRNLHWEVGCKFDEDWKFDPNPEDYDFG